MIISGSFYIPIIPLLQGGLLLIPIYPQSSQKRSETLQTIRRTEFVGHIVLSCNRSPCRENIPNSLAFAGGRGLQFQGSGFWIGLYRRFSGLQFQGSGFRIGLYRRFRGPQFQGSGFRIGLYRRFRGLQFQGSGFRIQFQGSGFRIRVRGSGFGSGARV